MALVDLRGREDEAAVRALLQLTPAVDPEGRRVIGWEDGGTVVGCAVVSRDGDELRLHSVVVTPPARGRGSGRDLLRALADVANATAIVGEFAETAASFFRSCGFELGPERDGRVRCSLPLDAIPVAEDRAPLTLAGIDEAIRASWSAETAGDSSTWSSENPARHHCDVTSALIRELLGGEILIANVIREGRRVERHAWNRLPSGITLDLTRSQFRNGEEFDEPKAAEPIVMYRSLERYEMFAARVRERLRTDIEL
ncbi:MAG TPA: GNAT family N-acetyltransferase [Gaiellaceae bacterium]|nr:GNAT family N-acetyltransferase [Gaiellaceae bacterium]